MAQVIGSINTINGSFFIKSADGVISAAKVGDTINSGDVIIGSGSNNASNMLTVALNDNSKLICKFCILLYCKKLSLYINIFLCFYHIFVQKKLFKSLF